MQLRRTASLFALLLTSLTVRSAPPEVFSEPFRVKMVEGITAYQSKDYDTAQAKVEEADKIQPGTTAVANMTGAIAMEREQYDAAKAAFERALAVDPKFFPARFNLTEIPFQQKKYAESRTLLEALDVTEPSEKELIEYKVFLTYLLEGNTAEAQKRLEAIKFPSDTPAYYFAHAAWEFANDQRNEAQSWIQSAGRIFPPHKSVIYAETLEDLGWLQRKASEPAAE